MKKMFIFSLMVLLYGGLLHAQTDDDKKFENWTEEQYQHYEDSIRSSLYSPVIACKASLLDVKQKTNAPQNAVSTYSIQNSYVPTSKYVSRLNAVGQIEIKSGVSQTGGKTYEVPIKIFPGMNGQQPNLALSYNSQQGNSVLGVGWSLSGLSQITRCGNTMYYNNKTKGIAMDNTDGFVLDGVHLIKTATSSDYLLFESEQGNIKAKGYVSGNVLKYFDVFYPDGHKAVYGFEANTQNKLYYPLASIADMDGNTVKYSYSFVNEHYYINNITYNGASVEFKYSAGRKDPLTTYSGGLGVYESSLMDEITAKQGSAVLGTYKLTYTTQNSVSLLKQIDYSSSGKSLNPLLFYYGDGTIYPSFSKDSTQLYEWYSASNPNMIKVAKGKFDYFSGMDGLISLPNKNPYWKHYRHSTGFRHSQNSFKNYYEGDEKIFLYAGLTDSWAYATPNIVTENGFIDILCADLTGNQQEDIIKVNDVVADGNDKVTFTVYRSNLYTTIAKQYARTYSFPTVYKDNDKNYSIQPKFYYTGDFNGDGKPEVLAVSVHEPFQDTSKPSRCYVFDLENDKILYQNYVFPYSIEFVGTQQGDAKAASNNSDKLLVFDFDGDGKTDICHINSSGANIYTFNVNGTSMIASKVATYSGITKERLANRQLYLGDFNGDGLMDFLVGPSSTVKDDASWTVYYSKGNGAFVTSVVKGVSVDDSKGEGIVIQDVNNDGKSDVVKYMSYGFYAYLTTDKVFGGESAYASFPKYDAVVVPTNLNSNNVFTQIVSLKDGKAVKYHLSRNDGKQLLATGMVNSFGVIERNEYNSLTDGAKGHSSGMDVYAKGAGATYPYVNIREPLVVFSGSETYLDDHLIDNCSYSYRNAVLHKQGLGFCGFEQVSSYNKRNQEFVSKYDPYNRAVLVGENSPTSENTYSYSVNIASNKIAKIRLVRKTEKDKLKDISASTSYVYDTYGNPTEETKVFQDNSMVKKVTNYNSYTDISSVYHLGIVQSQTVTTSYNGSSYQERNFVSVWQGQKPAVSVLSKNGTQAEQTVYGYDQYGNVTSKAVTSYSSKNALKTVYAYDSKGRVVKETSPQGLVTSYSYDDMGNIATKTDIRGGVTKYEYDEFGREVSASYPDKTVKTTGYVWNSDNGGLFAVRNSGTNVPTKLTVYDALEREVRSQTKRFDYKNKNIDKVYDTYGNLQKVSLPFIENDTPKWNTYSYDLYNRPLEYDEASGRTTSYSYSGNTVSETVDNIKTSKTYNVFGKLISLSDPVGTVEYNLAADGQPKSVVAPDGITTSFEYDSYRRRTALVDPSAGNTTYEYDVDGNVSKMTTANGQIITSEYDSFGNLIKKVTPEMTTSYSYNDYNDLLAVSSSNGTSKAMSYDACGRLTSWCENAVDGKWLQKEYSYLDGNVSSIKYTSQNGVLATENYTYKNCYLNRLKLAGGETVYSIDKEDAFDQPLEVSTGSVSRKYSYDDFGYPTGKRAMVGSSFVQNYSYEVDPLTGNLLFREDNLKGLKENFSYDKMNRLIAYSGNTTEYDSKGNILKKSDVGNYEYGLTSKPYAVTDVKLSENVGTLSNQDARYSSFGCPISIEENNKMIRFVYNENNDRVRMEVLHDGTAVSTKYYLGDCYELEQKGSDVTERLYLGGDYYSAPMAYVKNGTTVQLCNILRDNLGSITHVTDYKGNVLQELSYDAWGRLRNPADLKVYALGEEPTLYLGRGYTGHEHLAEFGLINMNARLYDPMVGRFLSPDPYVQTPEQSQNFNRYSYCMNNPLKYTDKDGKFFLFTALNAVFDGVANVFKHGFNFSQYNWSKTINAWNIDRGMFKGNFGQILNKWTYGVVNSFVGNVVANAANVLGKVDGVTYMDGMAAISGVTGGNSAVTIGHYSMGPKNYKADWRDNLFVHEYGHYIQSQYLGVAYFPVVAIPSLFSAAFTSRWSGMEHSERWFEQNASSLGAEHFDKKYGSGASGYKEKDSNYFQMSVFRGDQKESPYVNPRLGYKDQDKYFPNTGFKLVAWDFVYFMLPRFFAIY